MDVLMNELGVVETDRDRMKDSLLMTSQILVYLPIV